MNAVVVSDPITTAQAALTQLQSQLPSALVSTNLLLAALSSSSDLVAAVKAALDSVGSAGIRILQCDRSGTAVVNGEVQAFLDQGGILVVPAGLYLIDTARTPQLRSRCTLIIDSAATFLAKPNALARAYVLQGKQIADTLVMGGKIVGDRVAHDYSAPGTEEWNHGLRLEGCARVTVQDMSILRCAGDGISINGEDLLLQRLMLSQNRRQGITVGSVKRGRILDCDITDTGPLDAQLGTDPQSGIDIEPDAGGSAADILIERCRIKGNRKAGVLVWTRSEVLGPIGTIVVHDCDIEANANGVQAKGVGGRIVDLCVTGNRIARHRGAAVRIEGAKVDATIGGDGGAMNTIVGMKPRTPAMFEQAGICTQYDIQLVDGATTADVDVLLNRYAS